MTAHAKTFDETLRDCASRIAPGTERATEIMRPSGGASLETWSFRAKGPDIDRPLIMRRHSANVDAHALALLRTSCGGLRTIREVADEVGVPLHVVRFWESRFPQLRSVKRGGRRYYRPEDVELIRGIQHLLSGHGYTIKAAQKLLCDRCG